MAKDVTKMSLKEKIYLKDCLMNCMNYVIQTTFTDYMRAKMKGQSIGHIYKQADDLIKFTNDWMNAKTSKGKKAKKVIKKRTKK